MRRWVPQGERTGVERIIPNPKLKLLDQVREVMRLKHYAIRTERSYVDWIRRYVKFHNMRARSDLDAGETKIELFLVDLAVNGHVAASTQNQAFNALLFLCHAWSAGPQVPQRSPGMALAVCFSRRSFVQGPALGPGAATSHRRTDDTPGDQGGGVARGPDQTRQQPYVSP